MKYWEEDDEWEEIVWYLRLTKCHGKDSCADEDKINEFIEGLVVTRFIWEPSIDFETGQNLNSGKWKLPFSKSL